MTEVELAYPSGKLGAITRVKNKITKYCEESDFLDFDELTTLRNELYAKIEVFDKACTEQLAKF